MSESGSQQSLLCAERKMARKNMEKMLARTKAAGHIGEDAWAQWEKMKREGGAANYNALLEQFRSTDATRPGLKPSSFVFEP